MIYYDRRIEMINIEKSHCFLARVANSRQREETLPPHEILYLDQTITIFNKFLYFPNYKNK